MHIKCNLKELFSDMNSQCHKKQARLRSANMLRCHGQAEQCMYLCIPLTTPLIFLLSSLTLSQSSRLCSKNQNILKTDRQTDMTRYMSKHKKSLNNSLKSYSWHNLFSHYLVSLTPNKTCLPSIHSRL